MNLKHPTQPATDWRRLALIGGQGVFWSVFLLLAVCGADEVLEGWRPAEGLVLLATALAAGLLMMAVRSLAARTARA